METTTSANRVSPRVQRLVKAFSWVMRNAPTDNKLLRSFLLHGSHAFDEYRFDFAFRCRRIGVTWSAETFPEMFARHMMFDGLYQPDVLHWIRRLCRPRDTVFDVGAFHGLMSIIASKAVGPEGKVIAFEPNEKSRRHLERHLQLNGCANVRVESVGLMDVRQELDFYPQDGSSSWNSSFVRAFVDPNRKVESEKVPCTTLDSYVKETGSIPQFIKIDTEGTEFFVLKGAVETIERHQPVMLMEFNPQSAQTAGTSIEEILGFLTRLGYQTKMVPSKRYGGYDFRVEVPFNPDVPTLEGLANVVCVPAHRMAPA
jgi:FkbM family methyltransferase